MSIVDSGFAINTTNTPSASLASGPASAGNLLLGIVAARDNVTISATGWGTPVLDFAGGSLSGAIFAKVSDGTESGISASLSIAAAHTCAILEYDDDVDPLALINDAAENEANIGTVVASQTTGTATNTYADCLALAIFLSRSSTGVDGGRAYTPNTYLEDFIYSGSANRPGIAVASRILSATGSQSCTYTTTESGSQMYGAILLVKLDTDGGGGPTFQPAWALGSNRIIMPGGVL